MLSKLRINFDQSFYDSNYIMLDVIILWFIVIYAWREKIHHDLVRPTTVIQRWGEDELTTFDGNRKKPTVTKINAYDFQAFARVMPHSEFPSGSSCICTAYHEFTDIFTNHYFSKNITDMFWGYGGIDFGCSSLSVMDPVHADFLGCKQGGFKVENMKKLAQECGDSRLWGGMHFTAAVDAGHNLCQGIGELGFTYMEKIRNQSTFGLSHLKGGERPKCYTIMSVPENAIDIDTDTNTDVENQPNTILTSGYFHKKLPSIFLILSTIMFATL